MKIGILGGTFNPIHYGHLRTAEEIHELFSLDKTIFIPAGRPPFSKTHLAPAKDRYEMAKIAVRGNPAFKVSDIEIERSGVSYSSETMRLLAGKYKGAEFFFMLGIDAFIDLPLWKKPEELLSLSNIIVISRPGFSFIDLSASPCLTNISKEMLKKLDAGEIRTISFNMPTGKKAYLCNITGLDISATNIRRLVKTGRSVKYLLPHAVESYIISHKLYKLEVRTGK
ncbi:MAG: nicotinate-nucleotide adenylyltransferase [Nitrospirae bacterium]|nr:nicotinate-nucleotide adenylyltransferase [Nitrospirota bacterium]